MIHVEIRWVGDYSVGVWIKPQPLDYETLPARLEGHGDQTLLDQNFMPGVLAVFIGVNPVPKLAAIISRTGCALWNGGAFFSVTMLLSRLAVVVTTVPVCPPAVGQTGRCNDQDYERPS